MICDGACHLVSKDPMQGITPFLGAQQGHAMCLDSSLGAEKRVFWVQTRWSWLEQGLVGHHKLGNVGVPHDPHDHQVWLMKLSCQGNEGAFPE